MYMLFPGEPSSISTMFFLFESLFVFPRVDHFIIFTCLWFQFLITNLIPKFLPLSVSLLKMFRFSFTQESLFVSATCFLSGLIDLYAWCIAIILESPFTSIFEIAFDSPLCWIFCFIYSIASYFLVYTLFWWITSSSSFLRRRCMKQKLFETLYVCKHIYSTITLDWQFYWVYRILVWKPFFFGILKALSLSYRFHCYYWEVWNYSDTWSSTWPISSSSPPTPTLDACRSFKK